MFVFALRISDTSPVSGLMINILLLLEVKLQLHDFSHSEEA